MRAATYENSVFINCPFDPEFWPLLEAITFSVYALGFYPRCALEVDDSSQVRIQKITEIIKECRLSIHDISRTESDGLRLCRASTCPTSWGSSQAPRSLARAGTSRRRP